MKKIVVIAALALALLGQSAWGGQPQPCPPSEGLFDVLADIVTAPCGLVAACLGAGGNQPAPAPMECYVVCVPQKGKVPCASPKVQRTVPVCGCPPAETVQWVLVPQIPAAPRRARRPSPPEADLRSPVERLAEPPRVPRTPVPAVALPEETPREQPGFSRNPEAKPVRPARPETAREVTRPVREPLPELSEPDLQPRDTLRTPREPLPSPRAREPRVAQPEPKRRAQPNPETKERPIESSDSSTAVKSEPKTTAQPVERPVEPRQVTPPPTTGPVVTGPDTGTVERPKDRKSHMAPPAVEKQPEKPKKQEPPPAPAAKKPAKKIPQPQPCSPGYYYPRGCY